MGRSSGWAPTMAIVQITRDGGKTWTNVVGNVSGTRRRIRGFRRLKPAASTKATAYATFDRHTFGDMKPYAFKTTDYGKTWTALAAQESGVRGLRARDQGRFSEAESAVPGHGVRAVDFQSMAVSTGRSTKAATSLRLRCDDMAVQARESDLVLATHGRGIWIIDDISPLRALTPDLMSKEAALIPGRAIQYLQTSSAAGRRETRASAAAAGRQRHKLLTTSEGGTSLAI